MKIGIFGDSYSSIIGWRDVHPYKGWPELLAENYKVINFSHNGSSLYYSKKFFDKHYKNFDKIIFAITAPGRFEFKVDTLEKNPKLCFGHQFLPTLNAVKSRLRIKELNDDERRKYQIIHDYKLYIQNFEYEDYIHQMIVNDIVRLRPDTILIPCFKQSIRGEDNYLEQITKMEDEFLGAKTGFYIDKRKCHMSEENNKIIYNLVLDALMNNQTRLDLNPDYFLLPKSDLRNLLEDV